MLHLKCLTVSWTCFYLNNSSVICTVTLCYVLHQTHSEFWHIQAYSALLSHIPTYWGIIKPYSGLSRHLGSGIFWALAYLEPEAYSKPYETLTSQIHDAAIVRTVFSGLFRILRLAYVETWHIRISGIFRTLP